MKLNRALVALIIVLLLSVVLLPRILRAQEGRTCCAKQCGCNYGTGQTTIPSSYCGADNGRPYDNCYIVGCDGFLFGQIYTSCSGSARCADGHNDDCGFYDYCWMYGQWGDCECTHIPPTSCSHFYGGIQGTNCYCSWY